MEGGRESGWVIYQGTLFINVTRVSHHDKVSAALVFLRHSDFEVQRKVANHFLNNSLSKLVSLIITLNTSWTPGSVNYLFSIKFFP